MIRAPEYRCPICDKECELKQHGLEDHEIRVFLDDIRMYNVSVVHQIVLDLIAIVSPKGGKKQLCRLANLLDSTAKHIRGILCE